MDWQPIESAPKDTRILGYVPPRRSYAWGGIRVVYVHQSGNITETGPGGTFMRDDYAPTHWMPLPPPPGDTP